MINMHFFELIFRDLRPSFDHHRLGFFFIHLDSYLLPSGLLRMVIIELTITAGSTCVERAGSKACTLAGSVLEDH